MRDCNGAPAPPRDATDERGRRGVAAARAASQVRECPNKRAIGGVSSPIARATERNAMNEQRPVTPAVTQEVINLYDEYTHLTLDRRGFMAKLA